MAGNTRARNVQRPSEIRWVRLGDLHVSDEAQRAYRPSQAESMAADLDLSALGYPVVSLRDGVYWILDGQHRIQALRICGYEATHQVECEVYENLTLQDEAELFLRRDDRRRINAYEKYRIAVVAGRPVETRIDEILSQVGLRAAQQRGPDCVLAVGALRRVYDLGGDHVLATTLTLLRETFGEYEGSYLVGLALVLNRYRDRLDVGQLEEKLLGLRGGATKLEQKARQIQAQTGVSITHCVAAAIVDVYNTRPGKKVTPFFKAEHVAADTEEDGGDE